MTITNYDHDYEHEETINYQLSTVPDSYLLSPHYSLRWHSVPTCAEMGPMETKILTLKFFAGIREALGMAVLRERFGDDVRTAGDVVRFLESRFPAFREAAPRLLMAVNLRYAHPATPVADGDEIAFFPPVGGG